MIRYARLALLFATLALAACSSSGQVFTGNDGDSPAGGKNDWCDQNPPSGYCTGSDGPG